jgi:hypothetical protein
MKLFHPSVDGPIVAGRLVFQKKKIIDIIALKTIRKMYALHNIML